MPVSIPVEVSFFLACFFCGFFLCSVYDLLRCLRKTIPHNAFVIAVQDLVFWMVAGILLFLAIFEKNSGELRSEFFLGVFLGVCSWHFLIGIWLVPVVARFFLFIRNTCTSAGHMAARPAHFVGRRFRWTVRFIGGHIRKMGKRIGNILKKWKKAVKISKKI